MNTLICVCLCRSMGRSWKHIRACDTNMHVIRAHIRHVRTHRPACHAHTPCICPQAVWRPQGSSTSRWERSWMRRRSCLSPESQELGVVERLGVVETPRLHALRWSHATCILHPILLLKFAESLPRPSNVRPFWTLSKKRANQTPYVYMFMRSIYIYIPTYICIFV